MSTTLPIHINSSSLGLTTDHSTINITFDNPIMINPDPSKRYIVALTNFSTWYSWDTISASLQNNTFAYSNDAWATSKTITFPDGAYSINIIQDEINNQMLSNGDAVQDADGVITSPITLGVNMATGKIKLILKNNYQVSFLVGKFNTILGFDNAVYTITTVAPRDADISNNIDNLLIHCDLVSNAYYNGRRTDIVYKVPINVVPSALLDITPTNPEWIELSKRYINSIYIRVTTQDNKPLVLPDPISLTLNIKEDK